ncbi:MAG TPA: HEAT repeat domain-containing protein [Pirellulales bacterium]
MILALLLAGCLPGTTARAAEKLSERDRVTLTAKLRSKQVDSRLDAIKKLAQFPEPDAAKLLLKFALRDTSDQVRRAGYMALVGFKDQAAVCDLLVEQLNRQAKQLRPDPSTPLLLCVLLSSELPDVQKSSLRYVNDKLAPARDGPLFVIALADMLALRHESVDVAPLKRLAASKPMKNFAVRRSIVRALAQIDDPQAIDTLVGLLPEIDGEARADAIEYLALVTKQQLAEPADWQDWWAKNKATFQFPALFERPRTRAYENLIYGRASTYYGLPLYGRRIVFIIDSSGSMEGARIVAAKRELASAIEALKDNVSFGIVVFNSRVVVWKRELVDAVSSNKQEALRFVEKIGANDQTATYDALAAAFLVDAEAIYLLTDGAPSMGRFVQPDDIVRAISDQNRTRRESIYTIGIGPGEVGSPFEQFLESLAQQNFGLYRRVDE